MPFTLTTPAMRILLGLTSRCLSSAADPWNFGMDPDSYLWLMDPDADLDADKDADPDPAIFVSDLQDVDKKLFIF